MTDDDAAPLEVTEHHDTGHLDTGHLDTGGSYEFRLVGEIDVSSLPAVRAHLTRVLAMSPTRVGFELSGVRFIDSSGIGMLLEVANAVPHIALVNPSPAVARLVELCGLSTVLPITSRSVTPAPAPT